MFSYILLLLSFSSLPLCCISFLRCPLPFFFSFLFQPIFFLSFLHLSPCIFPSFFPFIFTSLYFSFILLFLSMLVILSSCLAISPVLLNYLLVVPTRSLNSRRDCTLLFKTPLPSETRFNCPYLPPTPPLNPSCLCLPLVQLAAAFSLRI
jgi:hypothetical protein